MKKITGLFLMLSLFLSACSTKFKVGAPYKPVSVVYGLLSMNDTAHYIKITRGFYDEENSNLGIAQIPDSLYYPNLDVRIEILNNGNVIETIALQRVDLSNEGYPKEAGTFATIPNYAYKFKKTLDPTKSFRLKIVNLDNGQQITGETQLISTLSKNFQFVKPFDDQETLDFSNMVQPFVFRWKGPSAAAFYDVVIRFRYQEVNANTLDTIYVNKDVPIAQNILSSIGDNTVSVSSLDFYKQINSRVGSAPDYIKRYVDTPGLMIVGGGSVLKTYIDVNAVQGGITFDQIKPSYTNFVGDNVFGILSTRGYIEIPNIRFNSTTIDAIMNGPYTKSLHIVGISTK